MLDSGLIAAAGGIGMFLLALYKLRPEKQALIISEEQGAQVILKGLNDAQGKMIEDMRIDINAKDETIAKLRAQLDSDRQLEKDRMAQDLETDTISRSKDEKIRERRAAVDAARRELRALERAAEIESQRQRDE